MVALADKIRVMVVDDSALMRKLISEVLMKDPEIEVVSTAMDGLFALRKIEQSKPDVVTLDLDMPRMDGLTTLRYIVNDHQIPVVLVSAHTTEGGHQTLEGLALGAVDFVTKPKEAIAQNIGMIAPKLVQKVKMASRVSVKKVFRPGGSRPGERALSRPKKIIPASALRKVIAIGISTGGPNAISDFLPRLPEEFPSCILIVQHIAPGFLKSMADWLDQLTGRKVCTATDGERIVPGTIYFAGSITTWVSSGEATYDSTREIRRAASAPLPPTFSALWLIPTAPGQPASCLPEWGRTALTDSW